MLLEAVGEVAEEQAVAEYEEEFTDLEAPDVEEEAVEETLAEGMAGEEPEEKTLDSAAETGVNRTQGGDDPQSTAQILPSQTPETPPVVIEYFPEDEIQRPERSAGIPVLRILEILFGLGVIGFSAAAWTKRKRSS
jgi:flagellar motor switch protein FliG